MARKKWGWTVSIEVENRGAPALTEDAALRFSELMKRHGGAVTFRTDHGGYGATFSQRMMPTDPCEVLPLALEEFRRLASEAGLPAWGPVWCELMTFAYHDRLTAN